MIDHNDDLRFFVWKNENEPYYFQYVSNGVLKLFMDDHCWFCQLTPGHADKDDAEEIIESYRNMLYEGTEKFFKATSLKWIQRF